MKHILFILVAALTSGAAAANPQYKCTLGNQSFTMGIYDNGDFVTLTSEKWQSVLHPSLDAAPRGYVAYRGSTRPRCAPQQDCRDWNMPTFDIIQKSLLKGAPKGKVTMAGEETFLCEEE